MDPAQSDDLRFDGRVAVVTGAGRGLGRAYALLLGAQGAKVVVNDTGGTMAGEGSDETPAEQVVAEITAAGGEAVACIESVATERGGKAIVQAALDAFGKLDILVHSAGNVRYAPLKEISREDFDAVVEVHFQGAFNVVRPAFPLMCEAHYGRIVLTASIGGLYGFENSVNYGMSKSAMIGLNTITAIEGEAHGVKSNIIVPGAVTRTAAGLDISQYPPMEPELVAPVVGWLAHQRCSITGEMLVSMAGRVARAYVAETPGVYQPGWTIADIDRRIDEIRDKREPLDFGLHGHAAHIGYSFDMARKGGV